MEFIYPPQCPLMPCRKSRPRPASALTAGAISHFCPGIFASFCSAPLEGDLGPGGVCDACVHHPPAWDRGAAAVLYEGVGRKLVLALKHGDRLDISPLAASWMHRAGGDLIASADLVVPAPMHWLRLARRRFNQAGELARDPSLFRPADRMLSPLICCCATRRPRRRTARRGPERMENVSGVFSVAPKMARAACRAARSC